MDNVDIARVQEVIMQQYNKEHTKSYTTKIQDIGDRWDRTGEDRAGQDRVGQDSETATSTHTPIHYTISWHDPTRAGQDRAR